MSSALIATEHIQIELTLEITWAPPSSLLCQFNVFQRQPAFQSLCVFTGCQLAATYLFFFSDSTTSMPKSYSLSLSLSRMPLKAVFPPSHSNQPALFVTTLDFAPLTQAPQRQRMYLYQQQLSQFPACSWFSAAAGGTWCLCLILLKTLPPIIWYCNLTLYIYVVSS